MGSLRGAPPLTATRDPDIRIDMSTLNIKVIVAGRRRSRLSDNSSEWILEQAREREPLDVELLDLRDYPMPFFEEAVPPGLKGKEGYPHPVVTKWRDKVKEADGFIIC